MNYNDKAIEVLFEITKTYKDVMLIAYQRTRAFIEDNDDVKFERALKQLFHEYETGVSEFLAKKLFNTDFKENGTSHSDKLNSSTLQIMIDDAGVYEEDDDENLYKNKILYEEKAIAKLKNKKFTNQIVSDAHDKTSKLMHGGNFNFEEYMGEYLYKFETLLCEAISQKILKVDSDYFNRRNSQKMQFTDVQYIIDEQQHLIGYDQLITKFFVQFEKENYPAVNKLFARLFSFKIFKEEADLIDELCKLYGAKGPVRLSAPEFSKTLNDLRASAKLYRKLQKKLPSKLVSVARLKI